MAQLELAQQELTKVGAALMKAIKTGEAAQLQVMPILKQLKKVNTALTAVINGEDDVEFSFDSIEESAPAQKPRKMEEQNDYGVDVSSFTGLLTPEDDPDAFDWRSTFKEGNKTKFGGVSVDMDTLINTDFISDPLGRMIDNT
ncbi:MAG: hypothetical protein II304_14400 [Bacteroidales bacterium]|nr:hypothetical protein [Bacteroidales bacterium]